MRSQKWDVPDDVKAYGDRFIQAFRKLRVDSGLTASHVAAKSGLHTGMTTYEHVPAPQMIHRYCAFLMVMGKTWADLAHEMGEVPQSEDDIGKLMREVVELRKANEWQAEKIGRQNQLIEEWKSRADQDAANAEKYRDANTKRQLEIEKLRKLYDHNVKRAEAAEAELEKTRAPKNGIPSIQAARQQDGSLLIRVDE